MQGKLALKVRRHRSTYRVYHEHKGMCPTPLTYWFRTEDGRVFDVRNLPGWVDYVTFTHPPAGQTPSDDEILAFIRAAILDGSLSYVSSVEPGVFAE